MAWQRSGSCWLLAALAGGTVGGAAAAYPDRPVRMIVPLATGGAIDNVARIFAQKLADLWGQQVVVDNRPGAGGVIGTELGAKAAPDGYTLITTSSSHAVLPSMYKKLPYDTARDFAPVTIVVAYPFVLAAHPAVPVASVSDLVAAAKKKPGGFTFASSGTGSTAHLGAELLKSLAAIDLTHVPYKGSGPAITGLLSGEVSVGIFSTSATMQHIKAGRLRALATTGEKRTAAFPAVPTVAEAGVAGYEFSTWGGMLMPAKTPASIISRVHADLLRVLGFADIRERLAALEFERVGNTPAEFGATIDRELVKWAKLASASGVKTE